MVVWQRAVDGAQLTELLRQPPAPASCSRRLLAHPCLSLQCAPAAAAAARSLERVLARHEMELSKSDRSLRIVRVDFGDASLPLIGARAGVRRRQGTTQPGPARHATACAELQHQHRRPPPSQQL